MLDLSELSVPPAGFGRCAGCSYRDGGGPAVCFACAAATFKHVSPHRCLVCDQALSDGEGMCRNSWCRQSEEQRGFRTIHAIAMRTGELQNAIDRYKFSDRKGWAAIFGRVIVGYLEEWIHIFENEWDLITAAPSYTGSGARRNWDHTGAILEAARVEGGHWLPFDDAPRVIVKVQETPQMSRLSITERRHVAATQLRPALLVPTPERVEGRRVAVIDDVFTDGTTLREIALKLRAAGATHVDGIVLARQPWSY